VAFQGGPDVSFTMFKPFRLLIPGLLFGALLLPPLAAQSATQREALDAFRDSLLAVQDPIPLQQL
jgi:hypothetical protein